MFRSFFLIALAVAFNSSAFAAPSRIVTLGAGVTETVFALGLGEQVVGVDVSSLHPPEALRKPKVGYVRMTSAEGIASLKPELVLASSVLGPKSIPDQLKSANIRLETVPASKSIKDAIGRIETIGKLLEKEKEAGELIKDLKAKLAQAEAHSQGKSKLRVLFIFVHGGAAMQVSGTRTAADAMINAAGAINAVTQFPGYKVLSTEALLAAKPDVILVTTRSLKAVGGAEALWGSPGVALTPAGQAKRLVVMDDLRLLGFGPRTGDALLELARAIYK